MVSKDYQRSFLYQVGWAMPTLRISGMIAPLEMFPQAVREVVLWTPFPYLIHFPAAVLIGLPVNLVQGFLVTLGWLVLFFFVNRWLWRRGLKQYSGMGA